MKTNTISIAILFLAFFHVNGQQVWTEVYNYPSNDPVQYDDVYFSSQNVGYALGSINAADAPVFILKTTDGGQTWSEIVYSKQYDFQGTKSREIFFSDSQPQIGLMLSTNYYAFEGYSMWRTTDGGQTWQATGPQGPDGISAIAIENGKFFIYTVDESNGNEYAYFYTSSDYGDTWNLESSSSGSPNHGLYQISFVSSQLGYGQNNNEIYKTTNSGQTWGKVGDFQGGPGIITSLVFKNSQTGFSGGTYLGHFQKTTDGGQTWQPLILNNGFQPDVFNISLYGNAVYASSFRSLDLGANWLEIVPSKKVVHLFDEYTGIAVLNGKIYLMDTSSLSTESPRFENNIIVYPNPAKDILHLEISDMLSIQKIRVLDIKGKTLKKYPGNMREFNLSSLAAGNYFLQLQTNEGKTTKKIVVK